VGDAVNFMAVSALTLFHVLKVFASAKENYVENIYRRGRSAWENAPRELQGMELLLGVSKRPAFLARSFLCSFFREEAFGSKVYTAPLTSDCAVNGV
jgi:hypothetical protein